MLVQDRTDITGEGPRIDDLRAAIKTNRVNFPVPVPIFPTQFRPDIQWRLAELYFIRGWSSRRLAERYGVTARRIQQSLQQWANQAVERGYLQTIPPEAILPANLGEPAMATATPIFSRIPASAARNFVVAPSA